jgi:hypothetical protein
MPEQYGPVIGRSRKTFQRIPGEDGIPVSKKGLGSGKNKGK